MESLTAMNDTEKRRISHIPGVGEIIVTAYFRGYEEYIQNESRILLRDGIPDAAKKNDLPLQGHTFEILKYVEEGDDLDLTRSIGVRYGYFFKSMTEKKLDGVISSLEDSLDSWLSRKHWSSYEVFLSEIASKNPRILSKASQNTPTIGRIMIKALLKKNSRKEHLSMLGLIRDSVSPSVYEGLKIRPHLFGVIREVTGGRSRRIGVRYSFFFRGMTPNMYQPFVEKIHSDISEENSLPIHHFELGLASKVFSYDI